MINNIYVRGNVYRQVVGIPMGCDCAPEVADLFLYWYEYNYITKGVDSKKHIIHFLKYASRYIDDLNGPYAKKGAPSIKELLPKDSEELPKGTS